MEKLGLVKPKMPAVGCTMPTAAASGQWFSALVLVLLFSSSASVQRTAVAFGSIAIPAGSFATASFSEPARRVAGFDAEHGVEQEADAHLVGVRSRADLRRAFLVAEEGVQALEAEAGVFGADFGLLGVGGRRGAAAADGDVVAQHWPRPRFDVGGRRT